MRLNPFHYFTHTKTDNTLVQLNFIIISPINNRTMPQIYKILLLLAMEYFHIVVMLLYFYLSKGPVPVFHHCMNSNATIHNTNDAGITLRLTLILSTELQDGSMILESFHYSNRWISDCLTWRGWLASWLAD